MTHILRKQLQRHYTFPQLFQVLLNEDVDQGLYEEFKSGMTDKVLGRLNHQLVTVIGLKQYENEFFGLISHRDQIMGWTMLKHSYYIFPKRTEQVKLKPNVHIYHALNDTFSINPNILSQSTDKILMTNGYLFQGDTRFELMFVKGELAGLVPEADLYRSYPLDTEIQLPQGELLYKDSNFNVMQDKPLVDNHVEAQLYFPELQLLKVKKDLIFYWLDARVIPHDFNQDIHVDECHERVVEILSAERSNSKKVIDVLLRNQLALEERISMQQGRIHYLERKEIQFENLKKSKLGRIQVAIWERLRRK